MKAAKYEFAEGARFQPGATKSADPDAIGRHIDFLQKQEKGELTPVDVVNDARNPNSPLHPFFEWDDSEAAEQYRLQQARGLIRAVVAVYTSDDKPAVRTRAFVHIREGDTPHYRETSQALSQAKTREMVLRRAWEELAQWRKRYADLKEFADLVDVIDKTAKKLPKASRR